MLDVCVSILALQNDHLYHFSRFHIYALIYDICFSLSDLLHSYVIVSRSIHISANSKISFLLMNE